MIKYMAFGYKSKYKRKFARKGRVAKLAKGKQSSVQALAKAVSRIQRSMRTQCEYLNYSQSDVFNVVGDCSVVNMCDYYTMQDCFGSSSNDAAQNKIIHKSMGIDCYLSLENTLNEPDTTQFTIFLVSLKDTIGSTFAANSGALALSSGSHYVVRGGLVLLNKKIFKIHKTKRVVLTNHGTSLAAPSAQTQGGTDARFYWKLRANNQIQNPTGDWKSLRSAQDPSKQIYMLIFSDNSSADLQSPKFQFQAVHTLQTVA